MRSATLSNMVRFNNIGRFDNVEDRSAGKERIEAADLPELTLALGGIQSSNFAVNSSSAEIRKTFVWRIASGDYRVQFIHLLQWHLFCALSQWTTTIANLRWGATEYQYVKDVALVSAIEGEEGNVIQRGINGWISIWDCRVLMRFGRSDLPVDLEN